jgi:hypothetical protein
MASGKKIGADEHAVVAQRTKKKFFTTKTQ